MQCINFCHYHFCRHKIQCTTYTPKMAIEPESNSWFQRELKFHSESVNVIKFTHDGNYCMTGSDDRTVQLWNPHRDDPSKPPQNALHIKSYKGNHGYPVLDIAIHRDNSKFVSAGGDKACFVVDVSSGQTVRRIQAHDHRVNAVDLNDDGTVLITCSYDQSMCVWDLRSSGREPIQRMTDFRDSVTAVVHTASAIVAGSVDGYIRTYDLRNGMLYSDFVRDPVTSLRLSEDGKCVVSAGIGGHVRLMDLQRGVQLKEYTGHVHDSYKLEACFSSDNLRVLCGSEDGHIYHWNLVSGQLLHRSAAHARSLSSLAYHPKLPIFISASYDGSAKCWNSCL